MRIYVLDWHGTLTTLGDMDAIKAFIDALHARGDYTMGYSTMLPGETRQWFSFVNTSKDLGMICEGFAIGDRVKTASVRLRDPSVKGDNWKEFDGSLVDEIVICDDVGWCFDPPFLDYLRSETGGTPWRYVRPCDLRAELVQAHSSST